MAKKPGSTESDELSPRERAFVEQYLLAANGAKAAEAAGYARKSAKVRATTRLLRRPRVVAAIKRAQDSRAERVRIDAERVLAELEELAFSNIADYEIDPVAGTVCLRPGAPPKAMRAVASIKHRVTRGAKGYVHEIEVRLWDKPSMLRLAGRHVGVAGFVERLELTGKDGNAIELRRRIDQMSDEELKARVAELIAKL
jgi:phage terminase small subunit